MEMRMFWFANLILGALMWLIGDRMDKLERAEHERRWHELHERRT